MPGDSQDADIALPGMRRAFGRSSGTAHKYRQISNRPIAQHIHESGQNNGIRYRQYTMPWLLEDTIAGDQNVK
jgi:hypothetical protein